MKKLLVLALLVAPVGCGKKPDERASATTTSSSAAAAAGRPSCNMIPIAGKCDEYAKEDPLGMGKSLCEGWKGVYGAAACPSEGLVGTCATKSNDIKKYYVTKDELTSFSVDDARRDCENDLQKGRFTPSANPPKKPAPAASASASPASNVGTDFVKRGAPVLATSASGSGATTGKRR